MTIEQALDDFICRFLKYNEQQGIELVTEFDSEWPSEAVVANHAQGNCLWQPVIQSQSNNFSQLEKGLGILVPKAFETYFCRYWSDNINAKTERGELQLLFAWNQDDFVRLQENLIAHVLMKRRLKQRETLFFAVTDEDDWILSVLVNTGEVVLERVGLEAGEVLSPDLGAFLATLHPA